MEQDRVGRAGGMITFVMRPVNVVRITSQTSQHDSGECLACGAKGILEHRLGTLWTPFKSKRFLVHTAVCPMNRVLLQQDPHWKHHARGR